jgi:hypothetical protein
MPHLSNVASLMFRVQALDRLEKENGYVLDNLSSAAFTLGSKINVVSMNKRAKALIQQGQYFEAFQQTNAKIVQRFWGCHIA